MGNDLRLQLCYSLIEQYTPIFAICIKKRQSAVLSRKWDIVPDEDSLEAKAQAEKVKQMFEKADQRSEDSLTNAFEQLCLASFRGRAFTKPFIVDGDLLFKDVQNWKIARLNGKFWWVDDPIEFDLMDTSGLVEVPKDEVCYSLDSHAVDAPGMTIYLRQLVGEEKWAQFVERNGNPKVVLTAPEGTPDTTLGMWTQRALQIYEGGVGVLPPGTTVAELTASRGQDPFSEFCRHQQELIAILATGGSLATLGGSTGLGSNLADKQNEQFELLVTQDCKKIANTLNAVAVKKICDFLGQKQMCRFKFLEDENTKPEDYIAMAKTLHDLGATIDLDKLREITGIEFISTSAAKEEATVWTPQEGNE